MRYVEGLDSNYSGDSAIKLKVREMLAGPGMMIAGDIQLDTDLIRMQLIPILKEELKTSGLDIEQLNKMLKGSNEDKEVAYELLKTKTKYSERIVRNLRISDPWSMMQIIREYVTNNSKELNTEIL